MLEKLVPENELEKMLVKVQEKQMSFRDFVTYFLTSDLVIASETEVLPSGAGLVPLLFEKSGVQMLSVFTSLSGVKLFKDKTPYCLSMKGKDLLSRVPPGYGLVVNPGFDKGFDLPPSGLIEIKKDLEI